MNSWNIGDYEAGGPAVKETRESLVRMRAFVQRQVDEVDRFLALSDDELAAAWERKVKRHKGWGDPASPEKYLPAVEPDEAA